MKNTGTVQINAPRARVFELINDPELIKQWITNLVENEVTVDNGGGVGSKFRQVYLENGRNMEMEGEVTGFDQDRHLACHIRGKAFDLKVDYQLEDASGGTLLTQNSEVIFNSVPMKIIGFAMKPMMKKMSRKSLDDQFTKLKELAEAGG